MLKSSLLNSTSWHPNYGPETETGTDTETPVQVPMNERPADGPGSGRSEIRKSLEKGFEDTRKAAKDTEREEGTGKFKAKPKANVNHQVEEPDADETREVETEETPDEGQQEEVLQTAAPTAWTKEAQAEWAKLPAPVQQAVAKREADMAKGVEELKGKYKELDQVLQPRAEMLKRTGHTPAAAVNQLFSWFEALNQDQARVKQGQPAVALTALAQSFGIDPYKAFGGQAPKEQQQEQKPEEQPIGDVPPEVQKYIGALQAKLGEMEKTITQKFGTLENTFAEQSYAKTNDILSNWSKDKPYFEEVRQAMAHMVGSGMVPPQANGSADLDKAYEMAIYAVPEVRTKLLADQEAKKSADLKAKQAQEKKAQQEQADKARKANVSLSQSAPGAPREDGRLKKPNKTVKDSIKQAMEELQDR